MSSQRVEALVDGHVHFHKQFDLSVFIQASLQNLEQLSQTSPFVYFLFLCETDGGGQFELFRQTVLSSSDSQLKSIFVQEEGVLSLLAGDCSLYIVKGEQIVTKEKLEILTFGGHSGNFGGRPFTEILTCLKEQPGSLTILPWGVGKWLGKRGRFIDRAVDNQPGDISFPLFLGDNGNRPWFWPLPEVFNKAAKKGVADLPGSDPLAFSHHAMRAGSYGFRIAVEFDRNFPFGSLQRQLIATPENVSVFGKRCSCRNFLSDQLAVQLKKRIKSS